jgi:uncharacterized protein (DUF697 family)
MTGVRMLWDKVWRKVLAPEIDFGVVDARLCAAKAALPPPTIWLLGKAQSGKTSVIRALTGSSRAEIGNGFRPCTRISHVYAFPSDEACILRFLDTRGLGEAGHDASAELPKLEDQTDLIIVVIKAMDHAQQHVLDVLRDVMSRRLDRPVLVLQTALHEGYPSAQMRHVVPYPYGELPFPPPVPHDLARSLIMQRELFRAYQARFVPIDFTLPEDKLQPCDYGLEQLWTVIEELLPLGVRGMLAKAPEARQAVRDELFRKAQPQVIAHAMAAGGAGAVPLPVVDVPLVLAAQARMLHKIAEIYEQPMNLARMSEIAGVLGFSYLTRLGVRELVKFVPIPGLGPSVSACYAAASTYALGAAMCQYFGRGRGGAMPDVETIRRLYDEEFQKCRLWIAERLRHPASAKEAAT